jgi:hypothetical protein
VVAQKHALGEVSTIVTAAGLADLQCSDVNGVIIAPVEKVVRLAKSLGKQRAFVQQFANDYVKFKGTILNVHELNRRKDPAKHYGAWAESETARLEEALLYLCDGVGTDAVAAAAEPFRSTRASFGGWGIETRFDVMVEEDSLTPKGLMKLRVLLCGDEPFLVIVDYLFRSPRATGSVGSVLLQCAMDTYPGCRIVLCTVRPAIPAPYAQQHEGHDSTIRFYKRLGFVAASPEVLALLQWMASDGVHPGDGAPPPPSNGLALLALANQVELEDSLPVLECDTASRDRPITWHELSGARRTRGEAWQRGTAGEALEIAAAMGGGGAADWLEPWMCVGAAVEVKCGKGHWWNAKVLSVRGGSVYIFYVGGLASEVLSLPHPTGD